MAERSTMYRVVRTWGASIVLLGLVACSGGDTTNLEFMPGMMDQSAVKAYAPATVDGLQRSARRPVPGTVARNTGLGSTPLTVEQAEGMKNPLPATREVFERGQEMYDTYCIVCHGKTGEGDGSVVPYFPKPPSLSTQRSRDYSDGRLFYIMTAGQNLMGSYAAQVAPEDRWAIAHYLRVLQRAANPTEADIEAVKEALGQ